MMNLPGRCATIQKETHHSPTIQKAITFIVRAQVSYRILPEVSIQDLQGCNRRICQAQVYQHASKRPGGSNETECTTRLCASGSINSTEICGYQNSMALRLFQQYENLGRRYWGRHLWAIGNPNPKNNPYAWHAAAARRKG